MINPNAQLLVDALRSGKYKQGKDQLATSDGRFCCLGVGCEVAIEHGVEVEKVLNGDYITYNGESRILPEAVKNWLGFATEEGEMPGSLSLIGLNDNGRTFAEIADIIESEPEGLFVEGASLNMAWGRRADAYARLMAAAPELLEALGSARDLISSTLAHVSHGGPTRADAEKVQVKIEAAIAKAKGEKQ